MLSSTRWHFYWSYTGQYGSTGVTVLIFQLINTYWARSRPMLKISMLPNPTVGDGAAGAHLDLEAY